jgi:hypothetical protein
MLEVTGEAEEGYATVREAYDTKDGQGCFVVNRVREGDEERAITDWLAACREERRIG